MLDIIQFIYHQCRHIVEESFVGNTKDSYKNKDTRTRLLQLPQVCNLNISWDMDDYLEDTTTRFGLENKYIA